MKSVRKRIAMLVAVVVMATGCISSQSPGGFLPPTAGGPALFDDDQLLYGTVIGAFVVAVLLFGAVSLVMPGDEERPQSSPEEQRRREVEQLTARAIAAAKVGQCEIVKSLDTRMLVLDREAHASVFLVNGPIRGCVERR